MDNNNQQELERQAKLLKHLEQLEEFRNWRDNYAKPELERIKVAKKKIMGMSEAEVKAIILYESYIEDLFYKLFENN